MAELRVLMTGATGFVGHHLTEAIAESYGTDAELVLTSLNLSASQSQTGIVQLDVTDCAKTAAIILHYQPTHVVHLAGIASPVSAAADPEAAWRVHVQGTLNVARSIMRHAPGARLFFVGSGLVYGGAARLGKALTEESVLDPLDEYAATKAAADLALGALAQRGLACVRFRPFNHIGPGQQSSFVVANFARQIARIEAGLQLPVIKTGNLQPTRDFLDVRDVARAYALALGKTFRSGTILNIASGQPVRIGELLSRMIEISGVSVRVETDVSLARSHELASVTGDASRARDLLGWTPQHRIEQTLAEVLAYWRSIVSSETDGRRAD